MTERNYFWIALTVKENIGEAEKYYAYATRVSESENIIYRLSDEKLLHANIMPTKKKARETVAFWNECYKKNGTYMFDDPKF